VTFVDLAHVGEPGTQPRPSAIGVGDRRQLVDQGVQLGGHFSDKLVEQAFLRGEVQVEVQ
jgi:hypothetical protein